MKDKSAQFTMLVVTFVFILIAVLIGSGLYIKSAPIFEKHSLWSLLSGFSWKPLKGEFGFFPFIAGTIWVTAIAILIALPLSLLCGIYLCEYAPSIMKRMVFPMIDILGGIPPVVYGVWGIMVVVPFISGNISPYFKAYSSGYCVLSGGIVLSIMITPLMLSILFEIFSSVPKAFRDASLSLGATKWQTIKFVILRKSVPGVSAACVLAVSRAFGETIAVMMVCGNIPNVPHNPLDEGYPLPALIANNYGELLSIPQVDAALMFVPLFY